MKLQLLMLTTVISMITEKRVEAQLKCYENRDKTGNSFDITDSITKLDKVTRACDVSGKYVVIFYSEENYFGEVNTVYSFNGQVYRPQSRFIPKSVLIIGKKSSPATGLFLFRHKNYKAGLYRNFIADDGNVNGAGSFQSAIIIGTADWRVVRNCRNSNYKGECWSCLEAAEDGRASFIQDLKIGFVMEDTIKAYKGKCINIKLTSRSSIPECSCNQFGVVDGPDKCNGNNNGICPCNANFTGDACDSCSNSKLTYKEGKCIAGCGCYYPGKNPWREVQRCYVPTGQCDCDFTRYKGLKCDICRKPYVKNDQGLCGHRYYPCYLKHVRRVPGFYNITTGHCKCKGRYAGHCDECEKGYYRYQGSKHLLRCFDKAQFDKVMELKKFYEASINNNDKFKKIIKDLRILGALSWRMYNGHVRAVNNGWRTAIKSAENMLRYDHVW